MSKRQDLSSFIGVDKRKDSPQSKQTFVLERLVIKMSSPPVIKLAGVVHVIDRSEVIKISKIINTYSTYIHA